MKKAEDKQHKIQCSSIMNTPSVKEVATPMQDPAFSSSGNTPVVSGKEKLEGFPQFIYNNKEEKGPFALVDEPTQPNQSNNIYNVNINPSINLFNFPVVKASGQLDNRYNDNNINPLTTIFNKQQK